MKLAAALAAQLMAATAAASAAPADAAGGVCAAAEVGRCAAAVAESPAEAPQQEHLLLQVAGRGGVQRPPPSLAQRPVEWKESGHKSGGGSWCTAGEPAPGWSLKRCSADGGSALKVKIMTYNLFWWNLFGPSFRNGNGGSAGRLIASGSAGEPYDFMGFQECEDVGRVLRDAGLAAEYEGVVGDHAVAMAYRKSAWDLVRKGADEVAEDRPEQYYGKRGAMWARFQHKRTGKTVLFVNHHGPLPVGTGGQCGRHATAWNLLKTIAMHAEESDGIVLVGDFNADAGTLTVQEVERRMHRVYTGRSFGGVDHVFSNCGGARVLAARNLGGGGSDHDALDVLMEL